MTLRGQQRENPAPPLHRSAEWGPGHIGSFLECARKKGLTEGWRNNWGTDSTWSGELGEERSLLVVQADMLC